MLNRTNKCMVHMEYTTLQHAAFVLVCATFIQNDTQEAYINYILASHGTKSHCDLGLPVYIVSLFPNTLCQIGMCPALCLPYSPVFFSCYLLPCSACLFPLLCLPCVSSLSVPGSCPVLSPALTSDTIYVVPNITHGHVGNKACFRKVLNKYFI